MNFSLSQIEKQVLFKKYLCQGYNNNEADFKIKNLILHLRNLVADMKEKGKTKTEIQREFLKELEKYY